MTRNDPGLLEAASRFGGSLIGLLRNRLELAILELAQTRDLLVFALVAGVTAFLLLCGTLLALTAWLAAALWPLLGAAVLGWIALAYGLAAAVLLLTLRSRLRASPPLLGDTLAELRNDASALRGGKS